MLKTATVLILGFFLAFLPSRVDGQVRELAWDLRWKGSPEAERVRGISILRTTNLSFLSRTLFEDSSLGRFVVTRQLDPLTGHWQDTIRSEVEPERWIRFAWTHSVGAENLQQYFFLFSEEEDLYDGSQKAKYKISTSSGFDFEAPIVLSSDTEVLVARFYDELLKAGRIDALAREIPSDVRQAFAFFSCATAHPDYRGPSFEVFSGLVLRVAQTPGSACDPKKVEPLPEAILRAHSPEALEFISRFKTVENSDPFQDRRP
jgi:hypothetical protein